MQMQPGTPRKKPRTPPTTDLVVRDIINSPAEADHELTVRTIAPAFALIFEIEAPPRIELLASTDSEHATLREWAARDPRAHHVISSYFDVEADERRGQRHVARLDKARPLTLRVSDL
jgi:hypothetical protein